MVELWATPSRTRSRAGRPPRRPPVEPQRAVRVAEEMAAQQEGLIREMAAEDYPELWEALTDAGKANFVGEVIEAFRGAAAPEDRAPAIQAVIEAWLRTWLIRQTPGYEEAAVQAREQWGRAPGEDGERVYTIDELRDRLNLPPRP